MKRNLLKISALLFMFLYSVLNLTAETIIFQIEEKTESGKYNPSPKGHRMPPMPIQCFIDTELKTIDYNVAPGDVISYEIWNEDETQLMGIYYSEVEFINALIDAKASLTVVIETETQTYIGYIDR